MRLEEDTCNTHECVGDEVCVARQDLVLTFDASGSLREGGFEIVKAFAANLTERYKSFYYGVEDMKLGLVAFGNGHLITQPDGTTNIAEAEFVQGLTGDLELVKAKIEEMTWLKGFTNMAQGFHMADVMLGQTGRADAQSAVLVISDGKFSMHYQTAEKANELKDKSVQIYLVAITEVKGRDLQSYVQFSSEPHWTNFVRIPGLSALEFNPDLFSVKIITKFCPKAFSPSTQKQKEDELEYMLIHEGGYPSDSCGAWTWHGKGFNMDDCAGKAREDGLLAFSFGKGAYMEGGCYSEAMEVTEEIWNEYQESRANPPCPNGYWVGNPYFDTYIMKPIEAPIEIEPAY
jgi:hypothetical protein